MTKLEKVIKGLEICSAGKWNSSGGRDHTSCPYYPAGYTGCTGKLLMRDALELLEAQRWRKFEFRELDEEEKAEHPDWCYIIVNTPDDGEEILVSNGRYVWKDEFINDGDQCYLDSDHDMENCWWMPLPEPPKEGDSE